jgi:K+-transporting ATPase ATPase C chain
MCCLLACIWHKDEATMMNVLRRQLFPAGMLLLLLTVITGGVYPLIVTGVAQLAFSKNANGSLILRDGRVEGSELIGQPFGDPRYFWGRPSATAPFPYNAAASSGSNLGPANPALNDAVKARIASLRGVSPGSGEPVPVDLVTASASGLDPHISPAAANFQVSRVAKARTMSEMEVRKLVAECTEGRQLELLGEPRVNVLKLNLALDAMGPR